jgi:hypothetical protein
MEPVRTALLLRASSQPRHRFVPAAPFCFCAVACSLPVCVIMQCCRGFVRAAHAPLQSVLFSLKTKQPSGAAGAVSFEVPRAAMEQLTKDLAAAEHAVLQASK